MKHPNSIGGKAKWRNITAKQKKMIIQKMNEARIKKMAENKRDAEAYRRLVLQEYDLKDKADLTKIK